MKIINISITLRDGLPYMTADTVSELGAQYDHNAQKFVFTRPDDFKDYDLVLLFSDGMSEFRENIGIANEYIVSNALTRFSRLHLQVAFQRGDDYRGGASKLEFKLLPSISGKVTPEPMPDVVGDLEYKAVVSGKVDDATQEYVFAGLGGNEVLRLPYAGIPAGLISMWFGELDNVPMGWLLCDGENDTPDLRDRFIVGAGENYAIGDSGGEDAVTLEAGQMPQHTHNIYSQTSASGQNGAFLGTAFTLNANQRTAQVKSVMTFAGDNLPHENRPPYFALAYIMKI